MFFEDNFDIKISDSFYICTIYNNNINNDIIMIFFFLSERNGEKQSRCSRKCILYISKGDIPNSLKKHQ